MSLTFEQICTYGLVLLGILFIAEAVIKVVKTILKIACVLVCVGVLVYGVSFLDDVPKLTEKTVNKGIEYTQELDEQAILEDFKEKVKENVDLEGYLQDDLDNN